MPRIAVRSCGCAVLNAAVPPAPHPLAPAPPAGNYAFVDSNSNIWTFDFAPLCNSNNGGDWIVPDAGAGHVRCAAPQPAAGAGLRRRRCQLAWAAQPSGRSAPPRQRPFRDASLAPPPPSPSTSPQNFSFNICGYSSQRCLPKGYTEKWQYGAVVQTWDAVPFCDPNNASTLCNYTRDDGSVASDCCTQNCEVLGVGTPIWSLTDPTNPASGGVTLKYTSVPRDTDDSNSCGLDPITQAPIPRSVTFNLRCSRGALGKDIYNIVVSEPKTCQYQINASSPLACGCEPMCGSAGQDNRICGSDGCGGYCSSVELEGDCPWANGVQQVCNYDTGTCCRPDCTGRQCGDDGCGGSVREAAADPVWWRWWWWMRGARPAARPAARVLGKSPHRMYFPHILTPPSPPPPAVRRVRRGGDVLGVPGVHHQPQLPPPVRHCVRRRLRLPHRGVHRRRHHGVRRGGGESRVARVVMGGRRGAQGANPPSPLPITHPPMRPVAPPPPSLRRRTSSLSRAAGSASTSGALPTARVARC